MRVTEVKVFPVSDDKLKAFVSVVIDHCFMVNDIKVIEGRDGRFISMPSRRKRNGKFKDIAHPLNSETRQHVGAGDSRGVRTDRERARAFRPLAQSTEEASDGADGSSGDGGRVAAPQGEEAERSDAAEPRDRAKERSLEEVTEEHLSDSFWTS